MHLTQPPESTASLRGQPPPVPHLHPSLELTPLPCAHHLLTASYHLLGICPLAVGKAGMLRAGHWQAVAKHYCLKSPLPSPANLCVALEEEPKWGSTGLCIIIKPSGQTFCDPGFSKFLSQVWKEVVCSVWTSAKARRWGTCSLNPSRHPSPCPP